MSSAYWALIGIAVLSVILGIVAHFGAVVLEAIATPRAFLLFGQYCLLLAIAVALGPLVEQAVGKGEPAETEPTE